MGSATQPLATIGTTDDASFVVEIVAAATAADPKPVAADEHSRQWTMSVLAHRQTVV